MNCDVCCPYLER